MGIENRNPFQAQGKQQIRQNPDRQRPDIRAAIGEGQSDNGKAPSRAMQQGDRAQSAENTAHNAPRATPGNDQQSGR